MSYVSGKCEEVGKIRRKNVKEGAAIRLKTESQMHTLGIDLTFIQYNRDVVRRVRLRWFGHVATNTELDWVK